MTLRLPWSDRFAALGRQVEVASPRPVRSRNGDEIGPKSDETLRLGGAVADLATGRVRAPDGTETTLRRQSALVLRALAARRGKNLSKEELFREVWPGVAVTDDSLVQCVGDIRRAIGEEGRRVLLTVPRQGYRLVPETVAGPAAPWVARRRLSGSVVAVGVLLVALVATVAGVLRPSSTGAELPSIAVLPFEDLSGEARWERLGRGLAAEIGADLSRSKGIVVIPAETVEAAAGEPGTVADALGVRFVLDGTVQAEREELRVTARLTDAEGGAVVWSDRWARPAEDLFAVQDEIVGRIGGSLDGTWRGALARAVRAGAEGRPASSLEAYELYLLGAEAKHEFTPEAYDKSIGYLRRALEIDPSFVQAMVTLSIVLMYRADYVGDAEATALIGESIALAERSAALDPDDPNALTRLSCARVLQGRRAEAWPYASRAVEIAPTNPDVLAVAAWCYMFADQGRAPLDWAERAVALNPGHPDWYNAPLAETALFAGDLDLARRAGREAPPMPEVLVTLAVAEALSGNIEEARGLFDRFHAETRYRSLSGFWLQDDISADPAWGPWVEGARLAGFPVTDAEAVAAN